MPVDALLAQGRCGGVGHATRGMAYTEKSGKVGLLGSTEAALDIDRLGIYGILRDEVSPRLIPKTEPDFSRGIWGMKSKKKEVVWV